MILALVRGCSFALFWRRFGDLALRRRKPSWPDGGERMLHRGPADVHAAGVLIEAPGPTQRLCPSQQAAGPAVRNAKRPDPAFPVFID